MSPLSSRSSKNTEKEKPCSIERSSFSGKSSKNKKWSSTIRDLEISSRKNISRSKRMLIVSKSSLKISRLATSRKWRKSSWRVSLSRSKSRRNSPERDSVISKDWRKLPKLENHSRRLMRSSWRSKPKSLWKNRRRIERSMSMSRRQRPWSSWRRPRRKKDSRLSKL